MKHMNTASDCCTYLYEQARSAPGRNSVIESDGRRVLVVQDWADADRIMRRNLANYPKNLHWFVQVAGNSRLTEEGEAWKFRWDLSQPFFSKYDHARGCAVSLQHAQNIARHLAASSGRAVLDEGVIHEGMLSIFTQMFLEVALKDVPMPHGNASRLIELASAFAFKAPGKERGGYPREHLREILALRKETFAALQSLRGLPQPGPLLKKLLDAELVEGADFQFEKELVMLFGAGTDTAAYSVGWALHLLAQHPEVQARLQRAVDAVYAAHPPGPALAEALAACPELKYFIAELLRLYPPLPFVTRVANAADQLSDMAAQPGDVVIVSLVGVNHKGLARTDPWVPDIDAAMREGIGAGSGTHSSFIWGPRVCGGRDFALLELSVVLGVLVHEFQCTASSQEALEYEWVGQMRRKGGHRVRVAPRSTVAPEAHLP